MKGDKGICTLFDEGKLVNKTKFNTKVNCQNHIDSLLRIEVCKPDTMVYLCKECGFWHLGSPGQSELYSK